MNFDFKKDILDWACSKVEKLGYEPKNKKSSIDVLDQFFNIIRNTIPPKPRNIKIAKKFSCPEVYFDGYNQLLLEIKQGVNLTPRSSRQQKNKHNYLDGALIDWNIHHLHLGKKTITTGKNKGLIEGYKDVIFSFIGEDCVYIIGIYDHDSWTKQSVLQTVHDNWPQLLEPFKINRAVDLATEVTDDDRKQLRKASINSPIKIGNNVYFGPGGGMTTAGVGYNEVKQSNYIIEAAYDLERWINNNPHQFNAVFMNKPFSLDQDVLKFDVSRFVFTRNYVITAIKNGLRLYIPSSDPAGSLIHPSLINLIEPDANQYQYFEPNAISNIFVESVAANT